MTKPTLPRLVAALAFLSVVSAGCGVSSSSTYNGDSSRLTDSDVVNGDEAAAELAFPGALGTVRTGTFALNGERVDFTFSEINGARVFEGDILLETNTEQGANGISTQTAGLAGVLESRRWPNGVVPFTVEADLFAPERVERAIAHWERLTSLRFVPHTGETAYVTFRNGEGCSSAVGRTGQQQFVNLSQNCSAGNVAHEIGHAIGLWHEQSRSDRDQNVVVLWDNIQKGMEHNFHTWAERGFSGTDIGEYDVMSMMHYGSVSFSVNGEPTLTRLDGSGFNAQRSSISETDLRGIEEMYPSNAALERVDGSGSTGEVPPPAPTPTPVP